MKRTGKHSRPILLNLIYLLKFFPSPNLPGEVLSGSPSLLWLAVNSGDEKMTQLLLEVIQDRADLNPTPAPGGTTILEIALSKGHDKVLELLLGTLYSR